MTKKSTKVSGSSPRMRGAQNLVAVIFVRLGIIPAYAGSTMDDKIAGIEVGDHPRVCGEHVTKAIPKDVDTGSSPRMRGAQARAHLRAGHVGIIPAYAGSTIRLPSLLT